MTGEFLPPFFFHLLSCLGEWGSCCTDWLIWITEQVYRAEVSIYFCMDSTRCWKHSCWDVWSWCFFILWTSSCTMLKVMYWIQSWWQRTLLKSTEVFAACMKLVILHNITSSRNFKVSECEWWIEWQTWTTKVIKWLIADNNLGSCSALSTRWCHYDEVVVTCIMSVQETG